MSYSSLNDATILAARLLLTALFLIFGWRKLVDRAGTVSQMTHLRVPLPAVAAAVSTFMELPVAFAVTIGAFGRLTASLMAAYTVGTALFGHRYWTVPAANRVESMDGFYKDLAIVGGFMLLSLTGPGKYSIDAWWGMS